MALELIGYEIEPVADDYPIRARYSVEAITGEDERHGSQFDTLDQVCTYVRSLNAHAWSIKMYEYEGEWDAAHRWRVWSLDVDPYSVI